MEVRAIRWAVAALIATLLMLVGGLVPAAGAASPRRAVPGSTPEWATPSRDAGAESGTREVTVSVQLALRDPAGAAAFAEQVSNPKSASYGQYLSPQQYAARFEATKADVASVQKFLTDAGLTIDSADTSAVTATGTLANAQAAFGTSVHRYKFRGKVLDAPSTTLSVPSAIADMVDSVTGLDQAGVLNRPLNDTTSATRAAPDAPTQATPKRAGTGAPPPDAFVNAPPCSTYFGEKTATQYPSVKGVSVPFAPCGYTPAQYRGAYGTTSLVANGLDGHGVTVAITDAYAAPTIRQDANTYSSLHGLPQLTNSSFQQIVPGKFRYGFDDKQNGDLCGEQGWYGEETLDVEAVHAMAPGANILYVAGRSCDDPDLLAALRNIIGNHRADIITNSWGSIGEDVSAGTLSAYHQLFTKAAAEGIAVMFSSGDDGDDSGDTANGRPAVDFPSTDFLVTSVGGTSLGVGASNQYLFETGWATGTATLSANGQAWKPHYPGAFLYGGGGGVSKLFSQPTYQLGVVPNSIAHGMRAVPDIAMDGDPQTGMLIGETQTFPDGSVKYGEYRIGGTSLSSPLFAGLSALADQSAGHAHGFLNPEIYALAGGSALHDVSGPAPVPAVVRVNFNNSVDASDGTTVILRALDDEAQSIHVGPGWDTITGVGTPIGATYIADLS